MTRTRRCHLCHRSRHVALDIADEAIRSEVASFAATMMSARPTGTCVAAIAVDVDDRGVLVRCGPGRVSRVIGDRRGAARLILRVAIRALIEARPDWLWLHAGVVADERGAWIFVAGPGAGKSTLVAELVARGCRYFSDEIAPIDPGAMRAIPFPLAPYRRHARTGASLSDEDVRRLSKIEIELSATSVASRAAPVRAVCFLSYAPDEADARIEHLPRAIAVAELMRHSFGGLHTRPFELEGFARLVENVTIARLAFRCADAAARRLERTGLGFTRSRSRTAGRSPGDRLSC